VSNLHETICEAFRTQVLPAHLEAIVVTGWSEYSWRCNGCQTCGPDIEHEVSIQYKKAADSRTYTHSIMIKFTDLLESLT
jgi:hypothetical protein